MSQRSFPQTFRSGGPDAAGIVSWLHIGDLHMTRSGEQNHLDLISIVNEINGSFAHSLAFAYIPGDVAEDGSATAYTVVRGELDRLTVPWCAIIGDHDVHEKSYSNYLSFMANAKHYTFTLGQICFFALNAFDRPAPDAFCLLPEQLDWLESQLNIAAVDRKQAVLLLHCYPTDLKEGRERLRQMVQSPTVRLIDMGHTHYNEVANDGQTLYTATRSTGQIEEGPVGFSITNIDGHVISWKFLPLNELPAVMITSPADERFITAPGLTAHFAHHRILVRAKAWGATPIKSATATLHDKSFPLSPIPDSQVWQGEIDRDAPPDGVYDLSVSVKEQNGKSAIDVIGLVLGNSVYKHPQHSPRDQDNVVAPWPERGLLGTQLGPNKTGRKW